ncbi:hypothetical protein BIY37_05415 [Candidatus Brocadia sapporoensis]|uniref:Uncharacterized protein n=1 Tax=Candidatus Brocadia sapporoensis TaxID=392547 RepID=A0A1V6M0X5_9BACT|nr:hypothetical protein [Candidatus Brocadia sapporoensis]MDG6006528.1 hypothetical protein [Candidatus Brocadia sp.]OQD46015.1 hypothetical protein BIY37_05415 [Candidatus Brocadia sapporoensis]GJQ24506.1 MAG: hypothetical protein HBSAPP01_22960 [Candidatus Brocadia sapporoensis]
MKNQYFGDINDYVKYGLLRCFAKAGLRIGVCWMLTPDDKRSDGRKIKYLSRPNEWAGHDSRLFNHLSKTLGARDGKHIRHIEGPIHIPHARFFGALVTDSLAERIAWRKDMFAVLDGSDLLFFDPDNGIEVPSKAVGRKDSSKYIYWEELTESWKRAKSLLVFQHFPRMKRNEYISARVEEMASRLSGSLVIPLRSPNVLFLLAFRPTDSTQILSAMEFIEKNWSRRVWRHNGT